mgnify:CR=1 FL=1
MSAQENYGTGRRKTAIARVRLLTGEGEVVVNGRSLEEHFGNAVDLMAGANPTFFEGTAIAEDVAKRQAPRSTSS